MSSQLKDSLITENSTIQDDDHNDIGTDNAAFNDSFDRVRCFSDIGVCSTPDIGEDVLNQSAVFVEDAAYYRSVFHKTDYSLLKLYRRYHSRLIQIIRGATILIIHLLAFVEYPASSLTRTADLHRPQHTAQPLPCGITFTIEITCLLVFFVDAIVKCNFIIRRKDVIRQPWLVSYVLITCLSIVSSVTFFCLDCKGAFHMHRIFRPFFLVQNSSLMKKAFKCLRRTVPQVVTVLFLLVIYLFFFTILGMCLLNDFNINGENIIKNDTAHVNLTTGQEVVDDDLSPEEDTTYFKSFFDSVYRMLILLTTANNPDFTMTAYNYNRAYALFFIVYLFIGIFCFMNMLIAVFYNEFKGYLNSSMQTHLFRRRLGLLSAYQVLHKNYARFSGTCNPQNFVSDPIVPGVPVMHVLVMIDRVRIPSWRKKEIKKNFCISNHMVSFNEFSEGFAVLDRPRIRQIPNIHVHVQQKARKIQEIILHRYFGLLGVFICFVNAIYVTVQLDFASKSRVVSDKTIIERNLIWGNNVYVFYYTVEQALYIWAYGYKYYFYKWRYRLDFCLTLILLVMDLAWIVVRNVEPANQQSVIVTLMQSVNALIVLRMVRIIPHLKSISIIWDTLKDIFRNLRFFLGILAVAYYVFAIIGMGIFKNATVENLLGNCSDFEKQHYYSLTFNDFAASVVVLWNLMIVNNWQVITKGFVCLVQDNEIAIIYFVVWWLVSAIIIMNIFTASILDIYFLHLQVADAGDLHHGSPFSIDDFHQVFHTQLTEPSFEELMEAFGKTALCSSSFLSFPDPDSEFEIQPRSSHVVHTSEEINHFA